MQHTRNPLHGGVVAESNSRSRLLAVMRRSGAGRADPRKTHGDADAGHTQKASLRSETSPYSLIMLFVGGAALMSLALVVLSRVGGGGELHRSEPAALPTPSATPAPQPVKVSPETVILVAEEDESDAATSAWAVLTSGSSVAPPNGPLRMPTGLGAKIGEAANEMEHIVARFQMQGRADSQNRDVDAAGRRDAEDGHTAGVELPGLLARSEPGVWDESLIEEFGSTYPTDSLTFSEMVEMMQAVRLSRLLRGGLQGEELQKALVRPGKGAEAAAAELRSRARGIAMLTFGVKPDLMLWAEMNSGGLVVAVEPEQWWKEEHARAARQFVGACEEAKTCCVVARIKWPTTMEQHATAYGSDAVVLWGLLEAAKDGFKGLHVGTQQSEAGCAEWIDGTAGSLPWRFDTVLINGPHGYNKASPGRMASIATAARLVNPGAHVFVRNIARTVEQSWSRRFFGQVPVTAMPPKGKDIVENPQMQGDVVIVPRPRGVDKAVPLAGDPAAKWTPANIDALAGTPAEQRPVGEFPFLNLIDLLGHFRVPGRLGAVAGPPRATERPASE